MTEAYLDESGIHNGAKVCVVAGYFGSPARWKDFEMDWKEMLNHFKVPIEEFHAKWLYPKPTGFFLHEWKGDHRRFLEATADTIARHERIHPLCAGLFVQDFNALADEERRYLTGAGVNLKTGKLTSSGKASKPYFLLFGSCVVKVCEYTSKGSRAHFFFGLDRQFAEYGIDVFSRIKRSGFREKNLDWKNRLGRLAFPLAKQTPQLQAADFLANLTYHRVREVSETGQDIEFAQPSPLLAKCIKNVRCPNDDLYFYTRNNLQELLKLRESLPSILN